MVESYVWLRLIISQIKSINSYQTGYPAGKSDKKWEVCSEAE